MRQASERSSLCAAGLSRDRRVRHRASCRRQIHAIVIQTANFENRQAIEKSFENLPSSRPCVNEWRAEARRACPEQRPDAAQECTWWHEFVLPGQDRRTSVRVNGCDLAASAAKIDCLVRTDVRVERRASCRRQIHAIVIQTARLENRPRIEKSFVNLPSSRPCVNEWREEAPAAWYRTARAAFHTTL